MKEFIQPIKSMVNEHTWNNKHPCSHIKSTHFIYIFLVFFHCFEDLKKTFLHFSIVSNFNSPQVHGILHSHHINLWTSPEM